MFEIALLSRLNYCVCSTRTTIPGIVESQSLNDKFDNDGKINQNEIMNNYSSFSDDPYYSNIAAHLTDVYSGVSYTIHDHELLGTGLEFEVSENVFFIFTPI